MKTTPPHAHRPHHLTICAAVVATLAAAIPTSAAAVAGLNGIRANDLPRADRVTHPAPIEAALNLLRWSPDEVPMIVVVKMRPLEVNVLAEAWINRNADGSPQPAIYIAGWSPLYRATLANGLYRQHMIIRLAGVLAHERAHIDSNADEEEAYTVQLLTLERLNAPPIDLANVSRARETLRRQQRGRR